MFEIVHSVVKNGLNPPVYEAITKLLLEYIRFRFPPSPNYPNRIVQSDDGFGYIFNCNANVGDLVRTVLKSHVVSSIDVHSDCMKGHNAKEFRNVTIDLETSFFFEENRQSLTELVFTNAEERFGHCMKQIQTDEFCDGLKTVRSTYLGKHNA